MEKKLENKAIEELSAWLDGELSPSEADRVERLVNNDPLWGKACRQLKQVDQFLDFIPVSAVPDDLKSRISAAFKESQRPWLIRKLLPLTAAAAAVVISLFLYQAFDDSGRSIKDR